MNGFVIAALACLSLAQAEPLFFAAPAAWVAATVPTSGVAATAAQVTSVTAANTAGASAVATATSAVAALNLVGAVVILKGIVIGGLLLADASRRGRRSAEPQTNDAAFTVLLNAEPAQCYRRLVCDLAAGAVPDNNRILSLFGDEAISPISPKFEFVAAAKVGKLVKSAATCELRYSCPLSTVEINKILA